MPQEHYVLRCFSCETFQAHIVKKAKKWECKMCGAKQSVKKNYGRGSGKDCRNHVMKLNELRLTSALNLNEPDDDNFNYDCAVHNLEEGSDSNKQLTSKWTKYLEPIIHTENEGDDNVTDICTASEVKKKKRVREKSEDCSGLNKKICLYTYEEQDNKKAAASSIVNQFLPQNNHKNFGSCKSNEKTTENFKIQSKNNLKFSKFTKYLDDDDDDDGPVEESPKDSLEVNKCSNIFESHPNDLDDILSLD